MCLMPISKYFSYIVVAVLMVQGTVVPGESHCHVASQCQTLSNNVVSSTSHNERNSNAQ